MIFHVDMDAFFAAVEIRDDPSLRGKPVVVGGGGRRGVVAAASYEARRYGCHSAMPTALALRKCPHAIVLPPRGEVYGEVSAQVFAIFGRYSPSVEPLSIDEAFLDMHGTERLLGPPREAAERLRADVRRETGGLTCSIGISAVKFIAKIASGRRKPDGLTFVAAGEELAFLHPLPIEDLWGIGPKTAERLHGFGVRTIGDLAQLSVARLEGWFGESGRRLHALAHARDARSVEPHRLRKSIGHEDTFAEDLRGHDALTRSLLSQATRVADRLVAQGLRGRRVQLKIRDTDFKTETRQVVLPEPSASAAVIYRAACELLDGVAWQGRAFRLTGVSVGALVDADEVATSQLDLFASPPARTTPDALQGVLSAVRSKFGAQALFPADSAGATARSETGAISKTRDRGAEPAPTPAAGGRGIKPKAEP